MASSQGQHGSHSWIGPQSPPTGDVTSGCEVFGRAWWRACPPEPCPVCNHESYCLIRPEEVICMFDDSGKEVEFGDSGYWHPLTAEAQREGFRRPHLGMDWDWASRGPGWASSGTIIGTPALPTAQPLPLADRQLLDRVYRELLRQLGLSSQHSRDLQKRALPVAAISAQLYASLPAPSQRVSVAHAVMNALGLNTLEGIPGFHWLQYNSQWSIAGMSGLLVPYLDEDGLIGFLQIRTDQSGDYFTFSSRPDKYCKGTKPRRIAHVAVPAGVDTMSDPIWITEGGLKANVAAHFLNRPVIGVPGVNSWRLIYDSATKLLSSSREIVVAYDMDKVQKKWVARNEMRLISDLQYRGHTVQVAEWSTDSAGQPKGIDDLVAAGGQYSLVEAHDRFVSTSRQRLVERVPPAWLDVEERRKSLAYAGGHLAGHLVSSLRRVGQGGELILRSDPFGVGKTRTSAAVLSILLRYRWPRVGRRAMRLAFLVDSSREEEAGRTITKGRALAQQIGPGAVYVSGRNGENCGRMAEVNRLGKAGHDIARSLCVGCRQGYSWSRLGGKLVSSPATRGQPVRLCPYLRDQAAARSASVHVMHKASLLNESKRIEHYDAVIVDEDLSSSLLKKVELTTRELETWRRELQRIIAQHGLKDEGQRFRTASIPSAKKEAALSLYQAAKRAAPVLMHANLVGLLLDSIKKSSGESQPLAQVLAQIMGTEEKARSLVSDCACSSYKESPGTGLFPHEQPRVAAGHIPPRCYRDLLTALEEGLADPAGDQRVHIVSPAATTGTADNQIELRVPRTGLIMALRDRVVINLDATPNTDLLRALFPNYVEESIPVPEQIRVMQITDGVYGKKEATKGLPKRLVMLLQGVLRDLPDSHVGVLTHWATLVHLGWIDPGTKNRVQGLLKDKKGVEIAGSDRVIVGYWQRDERATNRFEKCDVLIVSGLHLPPLGAVDRDVQAWRKVTGKRRPAQNTEKEIHRPYGYRDEWGMGRAYVCQLSPDPDTERALVRIWSANLRQAIGRLRATRSRFRKIVIVDCAMPADGVRVEALVNNLGRGAQPVALKQQAVSAQLTAQQHLSEMAALAQPIVEAMKKAGQRITRSSLGAELKKAGIAASEWEVRKVLDALL